MLLFEDGIITDAAGGGGGASVLLVAFDEELFLAIATGVDVTGRSVSYTHLTLPTNREV